MEIARSRVGKCLPLKADAGRTEQVLAVLWAVAAQKDTLEQVCADLKIKVGAEPRRGEVKRPVPGEKLAELEAAVNVAWQANLPTELQRQPVEVALDLHDQS